MGQKTSIEWCKRILPDGRIIDGHTHNISWGCIKVSEECKNCYAEPMAKFRGFDVWGPASTTSRRILSDNNWKKPLGWNKDAQAEGHRHNVFCSSMADVFEDHPQLVEERKKLWPLIENTPWLNWLLLTKRPENMLKMAPWGDSPWPDNVWAMTSVGLQKYAKPRMEALLEVPAIVHGVSVEPMLGPVDLSPWLPSLQWVICGGESGSKHRPFEIEWARDLRDQCLEYHVPFFFKQVGGLYHNSGGRFLDDRTWDEMPPEFPHDQQFVERMLHAFVRKSGAEL